MIDPSRSEDPAYLLSLKEEDVIFLTPRQAYARTRLLNAKEQAEILRMAGYDPSRKGINKNATKANHGGFKAYKNWMAD